MYTSYISWQCKKLISKKKLKECEKESNTYATEQGSGDGAMKKNKKQLKKKRSVLLKQEASREKKSNEVIKENEISDELKTELFDLGNKLVENVKVAT